MPCSIVAGVDDKPQEELFEKGDVEVGVFVAYASPRVIEIGIAVPEDYERRDENATIEKTVYLSVDEAKRLVGALQVAIGRGEAEIARRASRPAHATRSEAELDAERMRAAEQERGEVAAKTKADRKAAALARRRQREVAAAQKAAVRAAKAQKKREEDELRATLRELRDRR